MKPMIYLVFLIFVLIACQQDKSVQVVFDYGFNNETIVVNIQSGDTTFAPLDPIRNGYEFKGWFTDLEDEIPYDFSTPIINAITLHAKWYLITYQYSVHTESYIIDVIFEKYTLNDSEDILELYVKVTFNENFDISMYTEYFGREGIISLALVNNSDHLYSQFDGLSFNDSILDVHISKGEFIERNFKFSRTYFNGIDDNSPEIPSGTYQLQFMIYSIDEYWIETPIYVKAN